jgi:cobalt-precorrin 5A hydrolase / precorrin-3B C17-methyltransferase
MAKIAIFALNQESITTARHLMTVLPEAVLYGSARRTEGADVTFEHFKPIVQELYAADTAIIGLCAAGILIRSIAPLLEDKLHEPAVIAVASDGSAVVPLLGGLHGANELARKIADILAIHPAITTTGDLRFRTALLSPPTGYCLGNPAAGMKFLADCIAGAKIRLEGRADWLTESRLPLDAAGTLRIVVTEKSIDIPADCLVYHPKTIAVVIEYGSNKVDLVSETNQLLADQGIAREALAGIVTTIDQAGCESIRALARHYQVPLRLGDWQEGEVVGFAESQDYRITLRQEAIPLVMESIGRGLGRLWVVGTGPGAGDWLTPEVKAVLQNTTDWVGYTTYLNLAEPWRQGQQRHDSDNRVELERARLAWDLAAEGRSVAVISSGDPGIYAMAAAVLEALDRERNPAWDLVELQICPGISAMQAAAAQVGAPLGHDFCTISLSDILKPWAVVERRLALAAQADLAIALYNPISSQRPWQLPQAIAVLLQHRAPETPVILAKNLGRPGQTIRIKTLGTVQGEDADMRTVLLIGSSQTRRIERSGQKTWVYTPRYYPSESISND